jgi:hypothetical protein
MLARLFFQQAIGNEITLYTRKTAYNYFFCEFGYWYSNNSQKENHFKRNTEHAAFRKVYK